MLEHIHPNIKAGHDEFALYEIGKSHEQGAVDADGLPQEFEKIACVYATKQTGEGAAYYQARRLLEHLLDRYGVNADVSFVPLPEDEDKQGATYYAPGRVAMIMVNDTRIGCVGEYAPSVTKAFKLPARTAGFELGITPLMSVQSAPGYTPLSRFPFVTQDISLKVSPDTPFSDVFDTARDAFKDCPASRNDSEPQHAEYLPARVS